LEDVPEARLLPGRRPGKRHDDAYRERARHVANHQLTNSPTHQFSHSLYWRYLLVHFHLELPELAVGGGAADARSFAAHVVVLTHPGGHQQARDRARLVAHVDDASNRVVLGDELAPEHAPGVGIDPEAARRRHVALVAGSDHRARADFAKLDRPDALAQRRVAGRAAVGEDRLLLADPFE